VVGAKSPAEILQNVAALTAKVPPGLWSELKAQGLLAPNAIVPA
jgi:D-threo-aldose 1-dehydrogenase